MIELIIKFRHHKRDVRPPSPSPPPPLLIIIFMIFIIFLMQTIIKIRHPKRDFKIPFEVAKIPFELASQVQVEEIVFMAVRNFKASLLPPPAPTGGCCSPLCIIVSNCQMMAMDILISLIVWHFEEAANGTFGDLAPTAPKGCWHRREGLVSLPVYFTRVLNKQKIVFVDINNNR